MAAIGFRRRRCRAALAAALLTLVVAAAPHLAYAASLTWATKGPFETCLQTDVERWLNEQAERVVDQPAGVRGLDDAAVAAWTVEALTRCAKQGNAADATSEERFGKYMAQWRQHIYDLAARIRQKSGGSD